MSQIDLTYAVKRALEVHRDLQLIRYKIARKMMEKLARFESDPVVTEVSGYQSYVWVPKGQAREYRVWPPTLTAPAEGWLREKGLARVPIMAISWNEVFDKLAPVFRYRSIILESIKGIFGILTNIELEPHFLETEGYDGTVNYGDFKGWYKITHEGIKIDYIMPVEDLSGTTHEYTVTVQLTTTNCPIRQRLKELLYSVSEGIIIECPGGSVKRVQYSATECPALDQLVTLLRQILDQQIHCPVDFPSRITFLDGPLGGLNWTAVDRHNFVTWDGERAAVYDMNAIESMFQTSVETCRTSMTRLACQLAGEACPEGTTCRDAHQCVEKLEGECKGQCPGMPPNYCCCTK